MAGEGGGFEGVRSNPPSDLQLFFLYNSKLSIIPFEADPLVSLVLKITAACPNESGCSYIQNASSKTSARTRVSC